MITNEIRNALKLTLTELHIAELELNRPPAEVVTMSVCYSARHSLTNMLRLFLMNNNVDQIKGNSLKDVMYQCIKIDNQFSKINLSPFLCKELNQEACDGKYCLTIGQVNECVSVANQVKILVLEKMKINERGMN